MVMTIDIDNPAKRMSVMNPGEDMMMIMWVVSEMKKERDNVTMSFHMKIVHTHINTFDVTMVRW